MNEVPKQFHIGDILSITTDRLVSPLSEGRTHPMDGVYAILNYMVGDSLYTSQLPHVRGQCAPYLIGLYPWAEHVVVPEWDDNGRWDAMKTSLEEARQQFWRVKTRFGENSPQFDVAQKQWFDAIDMEELERNHLIRLSCDFCAQWLIPYIEQYGKYLDVWPIHHEDYKYRDPIQAALDINPDLHIIEFPLEPDEPSDIGDISW
ncbi:MAG: hypothetical protein GTO60_16560 [Gammaproteobacteria bacterium]|nr:hypothetical protein [Gammaproteobacteria bacterium]